MADQKPTSGFLTTEKSARTRLPKDLPDPAQAQAQGHPNGAKYRSAEDNNVYVLVHASWRRPSKKPAPAQ